MMPYTDNLPYLRTVIVYVTIKHVWDEGYSCVCVCLTLTWWWLERCCVLCIVVAHMLDITRKGLQASREQVSCSRYKFVKACKPQVNVEAEVEFESSILLQITLA